MTEQKVRLRKELMAARSALPAKEHRCRSIKAAQRLLRWLEFEPQTRISCFWPLGSEIDSRIVLTCLHALGAIPLLPRTRAGNEPLTFHAWTPQSALQQSGFGVQEPDPTSPRLEPEIVILPLLGFDDRCNRLGYGAGHYDCTIAELHLRGLAPRRIGYAFSIQQVESIPTEAHDAPLDCVVTDQEIFCQTTAA
jgi:5-formyltetrahydrofolate cyclo-ligase